MTVGGVSNMNYAAAMRMSTPSSVMRLNSPAAEYASRSTALELPTAAASVSPALMPISQNPAMLYFSPDGDIAEISSFGMLEALENETCETCENRRYVDQSDDSSVSFQSPTKVSPNMAGMAVAAHEQEHVRNEQANALSEDREVVNQSVTLHYDTCPECGKIYVSGGTTRTTTVGKSESEEDDAENGAGGLSGSGATGGDE